MLFFSYDLENKRMFPHALAKILCRTKSEN